MSRISFKEIPPGNRAGNEQDEFELFARDLLEASGLEVVEGPARGADGGRDLIAVERLQGSISNSDKRWLVSAKHFAHSGRSVSDGDEPDPIGRVSKFDCDGFLGVYSTVASSGLDNTFTQLADRLDTLILDRGRIENMLVNDARLRPVLDKYFPVPATRIPPAVSTDPRDRRAAKEFWACISTSTLSLTEYFRPLGLPPLWEVSKRMHGTYEPPIPPISCIADFVRAMRDDHLSQESNKGWEGQRVPWSQALLSDLDTMTVRCDQLMTRYAERDHELLDAIQYLQSWSRAAAFGFRWYLGGNSPQHQVGPAASEDLLNSYPMTAVLLGLIRGHHAVMRFDSTAW